MKKVLHVMTLSLSLSGLVWAANGPKATSSVSKSKTTTPSATQKNTDVRSQGAIAPGGSTTNGTNKQIKGTVMSIDHNGNRVRVKDSQGTVTEYMVNDKTEYLTNQSAAKLSEVQPGSNVTLETAPDSRNVAKFEFSAPAIENTSGSTVK